MTDDPERRAEARMTRPPAGPGELRRRLRELETSEGYGDDTPGDLYLRMLKDSEPSCPEEYPGAGEEFIRRYRIHELQNGLRDARRAERFGEPESEPKEGVDP